jgi:DNA polymerase-3 subunit epsilon
MLDWIKNLNKEYPEFWKIYSSKFEKKSNRFVVISTETTGLNPNKDVILSIGAVTVENDTIVVYDSFEVILLQYIFLHDNGLSNEFIVESKLPKLGEPEAIQAFVDFIGNAILVGHRIHFDIEMINEALYKLGCSRIKNEAIDIEIMYRKLIDSTDKPFSVDELCKIFKVSKNDRHSSAEDAYTIALLFLKLKSRLGINI